MLGLWLQAGGRREPGEALLPLHDPFPLPQLQGEAGMRKRVIRTTRFRDFQFKERFRDYGFLREVARLCTFVLEISFNMESCRGSFGNNHNFRFQNDISQLYPLFFYITMSFIFSF